MNIVTMVMAKMKRMATMGLALLALLGSVFPVAAQQLKPDFDRAEYADALALQFIGLSDSLPASHEYVLESGKYSRLVLTPVVGLLNRAALFVRHDGMLLLELRGTVPQAASWMENFYAGMVAASGSLQLTADYRFAYKVANHPQAAVHVGWMAGVGFLFREIQPVLDSLVQAGHNQCIITGHSQGGALSFLMTSQLHYYFDAKQQQVVLKNYASAAPKPGNQHYAYDYAFITSGNMGFRVVSSEDWVPETPFSLQTLTDMHRANAFTDAKSTIRKQPFFIRLYMSQVYGKLDRRSAKSARTFRKYLGEDLYKLVSKELPGFARPTLLPTIHYATAGVPIILMADSAYLQAFAFDGKNIFLHHMYPPYKYLLDLHYPKIGSH